MFQDVSYYKPALASVLARYQRLYAATGPGHVLVYAMPPVTPPEPVPPLNEVDWEHGLEDYLDLSLRNYAASLEVTRQVPDDLLPSFGLFFGIGDYSAYVAGEVEFTADTSWAAPVIRDWADLDRLELRADSYWTRFLERALRHVLQYTKPAGIPVVRGYYSPLDMAHALRGEALFTDFYEAPEQVQRLLAFSAQATIWIASRLQALIGQYWQGNVAGAWLPPGTICMSEDIACMVSPAIYARFARPYTQQVIDAFGHGQIHTHSLGLRALPEITQLRNLVGVQISEDPNTPPTFASLDKLLPNVHGVPLSVTCTPAEAIAHAADLAARANIILAVSVADVAEGRAVVEAVRRAAGE